MSDTFCNLPDRIANKDISQLVNSAMIFAGLFQGSQTHHTAPSGDSSDCAHVCHHHHSSTALGKSPTRSAISRSI